MTIKKSICFSILLCALSACSSSDDDNSRDMTYPEIVSEGIVANPTDCQVYQRGDVIPFDYVFKDDTDPGDYHFMIRLTDRAGWQQLKAMAIKVE